MTEKSLSQLYFEATGLTQVNVEEIVENIKSMEKADAIDAIGKLLWKIPGGATSKGSEFKKALFAELPELLGAADVDGDGDVDADDVVKMEESPVDIDGDEELTSDDMALLKSLVASTAEIVSDETTDEGGEENPDSDETNGPTFEGGEFTEEDE
jgi:hypothetical protein